MREMQPYLSEEDDFSELTDISSSIFCLISGKIREYSQPRPPGPRSPKSYEAEDLIPLSPFVREEAAAAWVRVRGPAQPRSEGTRREAAGPGRPAHMTGHGGGRNHSAGWGGGASPQREPTRLPGESQRQRCPRVRGGELLSGGKSAQQRVYVTDSPHG